MNRTPNRTGNRTQSLKELCISQLEAQKNKTPNRTPNKTGILPQQDSNKTEAINKHDRPFFEEKATERIRQKFSGELDRAFYPAGSEWII